MLGVSVMELGLEAKLLLRGAVVGCNLLFLCPPGLNCFPTALTTGKPRAGISRRVKDKLAWMSTVHKSYPSTARLFTLSLPSARGLTCFCPSFPQVQKCNKEQNKAHLQAPDDFTYSLPNNTHLQAPKDKRQLSSQGPCWQIICIRVDV